MTTIPLASGLVALVDDEDAELASFRWFAWRHDDQRRTWYALRNGHRPDGSPVAEKLHRVVWARAHPGEEVPPALDHANGDGLDCRRGNLRPATRSQNSANQLRRSDNTSGYVGVQFMRDKPRSRPWQARVQVGGRRERVGTFATAEEAARARDEAARAIHGEFAIFNFPRPGERKAV